MQRENHAKGKAVSGVSSTKNHDLTNDINGAYGNDILVGSDYADVINGYAGNDKIYGKAGDDRLNGGDGYDYIEGGAGVDRLAGGAGSDALEGGAGSDVIRGEDGDDLVLGGDGDDASLSGGAGDDFVFGGQGNDLMAGGTGDDTLVGGQGADRMYGNQGSDTFVYKDLSDSTAYKTDYIHDFQTNHDILDFRALNLSADDLHITHNGTNYRVSAKHSDFTIDVQTRAGRTLTFDDILLTDQAKTYGDMNDNRMTVDHKQSVYGMAGADRLDASKGKGFNNLYGGEGDDLLRGAHHDHLYGGDGADRLVSKGKGFNYLSGGDGKDVIYSNASHDEINAGAGDDIMHAFNNHTRIDGGEGADTLHLSGKHSDYAFETKGDQVIVSRLNGDKPETHILSGVERLHFSDKTASDMQGNLVTYEAPAGNAAIDWVKMTLEGVKANFTPMPLFASRALAIESVAVLDTLRGIAGKEGFTANIDAPDVISEDASVAAAAHRVLTTLFPNQKAIFDEAFTKSLDGIEDGMAENNGVTYGRAVADAVLADRANDGSAKMSEWYGGGTAPGEWRPTPAGYASGLSPHWGSVKPFILNSGDQFRPAPPPAIGSDEYVKQYNEVKSLGASDSTTRTQDQTEIALFWADGIGTVTPPGHWAEIASDILTKDNASLSDSAELFATLNTALSDSAVAAWEAKYHYNYWRPVTAIHEGENDGNGMTQGDPNWKPFINTPPFPEYVSGHATFSGAGSTVLTDLLGDLAFASMSATYTREFESFFEAAEEAGISRVYGGIHFQEANTSGRALGQSIGEQALQKFA